MLSNFYILDTVEFTLSAEDPAASLSLTGPDGEVAGTSAVNGTKVTLLQMLHWLLLLLTQHLYLTVTLKTL